MLCASPDSARFDSTPSTETSTPCQPLALQTAGVESYETTTHSNGKQTHSKYTPSIRMSGLNTSIFSWHTLTRVTNTLANIATSITHTIWSKPALPSTPILRAVDVSKIKVGDVLPNGRIVSEDDHLLVVVDEWFLDWESERYVRVKHESVVVVGKKE